MARVADISLPQYIRENKKHPKKIVFIFIEYTGCQKTRHLRHYNVRFKQNIKDKIE